MTNIPPHVPFDQFDRLPWKLIVSPSNNGTCPSLLLKLAPFYIINAASATGVYYFSSHRVAKLTHNLLGGEDDTGSYKYIFRGILIVLVRIITNVINAAILRHDGTPETLLRIVLLFLLRPRATFMTLAFAWKLGDGYIFGAKSAAIQELIMLTISLATLSMTLAYGVRHGDFPLSSSQLESSGLMYIGAVMQVVFYPLITVLIFMSTPFHKVRRSNIFFCGVKVTSVAVTLRWLMCLTLLSQWMFWGGFFRLAGNLYCPGINATVAITFVWLIGSVLTTFLGVTG